MIVPAGFRNLLHASTLLVLLPPRCAQLLPGCFDSQQSCAGMVKAAAGASCSCLSDLSAYAVGIQAGSALADLCCESCMVQLLSHNNSGPDGNAGCCEYAVAAAVQQ